MLQHARNQWGEGGGIDARVRRGFISIPDLLNRLDSIKVDSRSNGRIRMIDVDEWEMPRILIQIKRIKISIFC